MKSSSMLRGAQTMLPVLLGIIPFAMITGITAVNTGVSPGMTMFMSLFIFAGAAQLAVLQLIHTGASSLVILYTAIIINFRFMIYSLSIAPYFKKEPFGWKVLLSHLMTDQSYAMSLAHFINDPDENPRWFYLGASLIMWAVWQTFTFVGIMLGAVIPSHLGLDFAIPLTFIAVLMKSVNDMPVVAAVVTGGFVAVIAAPIPMNGGLILAAISGIAAGALVEHFGKHKAEEATHHD
ncbi:AzlC family ABC transporter permease [Anoxynatronum sibiricum]|uniref:AzlC family ABC transporter permease n=1 Tax=Anoxynatronum sibiricum TaxID=210623 RepID=A0ABU9VRZ1_9CLOT